MKRLRRYSTAEPRRIPSIWAGDAVTRRRAGVVFTSDSALPRGRSTIGRYVDLLDDLLGSNQKDGAFVDRVHWLGDVQARGD